MHRFRLPTLSCGHCVYAVTKAIKGVDPLADIEIDIAARRAAVRSNRPAIALAAAIDEAGFKVETLS